MKIESNILKYHLRNVYFIGGNACGGKTTMSKLIAQKYGFYLYNEDEHYGIHRAIANDNSQPAMCYQRVDFEKNLNRPVDEYIKWTQDSLKEQSEMVIIDLIKLSENQIVVADVLFTPDYIDEIVDKDHAIFLTTNYDLLRSVYFNRPEKKEFYNCVMSLSNPEKTFQNIFRTLEEANKLENHIIRNSKFNYIQRDEKSSIKNTLRLIEKYFGLSEQDEK